MSNKRPFDTEAKSKLRTEHVLCILGAGRDAASSSRTCIRRLFSTHAKALSAQSTLINAHEKFISTLVRPPTKDEMCDMYYYKTVSVGDTPWHNNVIDDDSLLVEGVDITVGYFHYGDSMVTHTVNWTCIVQEWEAEMRVKELKEAIRSRPSIYSKDSTPYVFRGEKRFLLSHERMESIEKLLVEIRKQ